jgi:hypothetical protein
MGVLHGVAYADEQIEPSADAELVLVAEINNGDAADKLHDKVGPARRGLASVQDMGDVGMLHDRQRLPLSLESRDHLPRVHARLEDFQRHLASNRLRLLGHEHHAEAPLADLLEQLVRADDRAGTLGHWLVDGGHNTLP